MTAFNSASNITASLLVDVVVVAGGTDGGADYKNGAADDGIAPPRLLHAPFGVTKSIVNFTLKSLPEDAKRVLFVTSRCHVIYFFQFYF